jgi:hypothetical protein
MTRPEPPKCGATPGLATWSIRVACLLVLAPASAAQLAAPAEGAARGDEWESIRSVGQHPRLEKFVTLGAGVDRGAMPSSMGWNASVGVHKTFGNPVVGMLGMSGELYTGQFGRELDGGGRVMLNSPAFLLRAGVDWNARLERADFITGLTFPVRRGGWPTPGSQLRLDWIPARNHTGNVAVVFPVGQPLAGRTRNRETGVRLPRGTMPEGATAPHFIDAELRRAMSQARRHMTQLVSILTFYWLIEDRHLRHASSIAAWREVLHDFAAEFFDSETGDLPRYDQEAEAYHAALDMAFGLAADDRARGRPLADEARREVLTEVILPYNRTIGQYREKSTLLGLGERARARYTITLYRDPELSAEQRDLLLAVFDSWLLDLEALRARIDRTTSDPRFNWLPLALVLRPEEHRTRSQIDALVELGLNERFTGGNEVFTIDGPQFQRELWRTLAEAESYHVLWIHDYRGRDDVGNPDQMGFRTTLEYLRALRAAVQRYDSTGRLATYMIVMDQFFYEETDGRRWMTLLERPLTHRVRLDTRYAWMEYELAAQQDSLRAAVQASTLLQAQGVALGRRWIERLVKVHVSITNPSDFSFRSPRIFGPAFGADNLARDHRKMILRDLDESDPGAGELILSGVGVGDHYASATWDDRAVIVRGPGAAPAVAYLREVLSRHGLGGQAMPPPLRPRPAGGLHAERVAEREQTGADARFLQVHNQTGWGAKDATFVQMLLYDLAPSGSVIVVPDGVWTSYQWMAQLVGAALRGCHVYAVAPAFGNAPSRDFPQMSVMQELVARLVLVEETMGEVIRAGGGDLRVGFLARDEPLDDHQKSLSAVLQTAERDDFLSRMLPLTVESKGSIARAAERAATALASPALVRDARPRGPQLHRKTQWILSGNVLADLMHSPAFPALLDQALDPAGATLWASSLTGPAADSARRKHVRDVLALYAATPSADADEVLYFMSGSINKNIRSMTLDAEVLGLVSGPWALESSVDLLLLLGSVTWVETLADAERHLPPYGTLRKLIGRRMHRLL